MKTELEYTVRARNEARFGSIAHEYTEHLCGTPPTATICDFHIHLDTKTLCPTQNRITNRMASTRVLHDTVYEW